MNQRDRFDNGIIHSWATGKQNPLGLSHKPNFFPMLSGLSDYKVKFGLLLAVLGLAFIGKYPLQAQVPPSARQLLVAIAPGWTSHNAMMQCYQRDGERGAWKPAFQNSWPVLVGRS